MANDKLLQMRKFGTIVQRAQAIDMDLLRDIMKEYVAYTEAAAIILPKTGVIFPHMTPDGTELVWMESLRYNQFSSVYEAKVNIPLSEYRVKSDHTGQINSMNSVILPVLANSERIAFLLAYREKGFTDDDIMFTEYVASFAGVIIAHRDNAAAADGDRKKMLVKSAINTLSYSELETIIQIFQELGGDEGLIVASKIADRLGITRSICVNALKKFESAGVVESRSLGVKGTFIKVVNPYLREELSKMK